MPRTPDVARKAELLAAVIDDCAANGIGHRSLRELAEAVGTSHRMLIHHFGSREDLLVAIVEEVEGRQIAQFKETPDFTVMWKHFSAPRLRPFERLFFECYARGAQGEQPFARMHPGAVHRWLAELGDAPEIRLGLAVTRGLLLDLVATNDRKAVTAAADVYDAMQRRSARDSAVRSIGLGR